MPDPGIHIDHQEAWPPGTGRNKKGIRRGTLHAEGDSPGGLNSYQVSLYARPGARDRSSTAMPRQINRAWQPLTTPPAPARTRVFPILTR